MTAASLRGRTVLVPVGGASGDRIARAVQQRGGTARLVPLTRTADAPRPAELRAAAQRLSAGGYDWVVLTSANGVDALARALDSVGTDLESHLGGARIAALGPATAAALARLGAYAHLVPQRDYSAQGLADALLAKIGSGGEADATAAARALRILLPLSASAGALLHTALAAAGHDAERVDAYRTVPAPVDVRAAADVAEGRIDAILVLSGSGAIETHSHFGRIAAGTTLAAIGPPTATALAALGLHADVVAGTHTVPALLNALTAHLSTLTEGSHP